MKVSTVTSIIIALVLIIGALSFADKIGPNKTSVVIVPVDNVSIENGVQIVQIIAKGGYQPRTSIAQAGVPTILRFKTKGTFDCSASIRIPRLNISRFLATTGSTDIDLGKPELGRLQGSCGMGMYPFEVDFK